MIPARRSEPIMRFFDGYVARYLRRRFHRVWCWRGFDAAMLPRDVPLLFVLSHAACWDVLVGYHLARAVVRVESYAPMDEQQLHRYRILTRLGVYSVDRFSASGLRAFVHYTVRLLTAGRAVWITPQGEIVSAWRRPVRFQRGVGPLVRRLPEVAVVPVAAHYEFGEEPRPEIFVKFGPPRRFRDSRSDAAEITQLLERDLEAELDAVQAALLARDLRTFTVLLEGATSTSTIYDRVRALRAWLTGGRDPARHGAIVSDPRRGITHE
jgi:1-acyl-sn-glycerol-3-phosphate acyltransferase